MVPEPVENRRYVVGLATALMSTVPVKAEKSVVVLMMLALLLAVLCVTPIMSVPAPVILPVNDPLVSFGKKRVPVLLAFTVRVELVGLVTVLEILNVPPLLRRIVPGPTFPESPTA